VDCVEARRNHQRVDLPPDQRVAAGLSLERHLASDRGARPLTVGMEVGGPVIALDDGHRPAGTQQLREQLQRCDGAREVLEHEADEDVVERLRREREVEDVGLAELDVAQPRFVGLAPGLRDRLGRDIDAHETRAGAARRERDGLRADAASGLEHHASVGIGRVAVQQLEQRVGLIGEALVLPGVVAVDVVAAGRHRTKSITRSRSPWVRTPSSSANTSGWATARA
jgi:hypothetical protein